MGTELSLQVRVDRSLAAARAAVVQGQGLNISRGYVQGLLGQNRAMG